MSVLKKLSVLTAAVLALGAIGAGSASAAQFTASATGELGGRALTKQVFTFSGGAVTCTSAVPSGTIESVASEDLHFTIKYGECTFSNGLGTFAAEVSPATFTVTATGTVHLQNTVTIKVASLQCHLTIKPQSLNLVNFTNTFGRIKLLFQLANILYTSAGLCGSEGSNGTLGGEIEIERVGGGSISWDP